VVTRIGVLDLDDILDANTDRERPRKRALAADRSAKTTAPRRRSTRRLSAGVGIAGF
jgi:hypothetical protein